MNKVEMYMRFRKELDEMCVPVILEEMECIEYIVYDGKTVGMVVGNPHYIDCVYVLPKYRRKGLAKKAVLEWYDRHRSKMQCVNLHIINNNEVAKKFWNSLFELEEIETNAVDTRYWIINKKKGVQDEQE